MKSLILYATSHGASAEAAQFLSKKLGECAALDIRDNPIPDLAAYDTVILGGSIHMGQIQSSIRKLIAKHSDTLLSKRLGLYLCCMYEGDAAKMQFDTAYPQPLRDIARAKGIFGGRLDFAKMNLVERAIVKKVAGVKESVSRMNRAEMKRFANAMSVMP